jgi:hypothetical protein
MITKLFEEQFLASEINSYYGDDNIEYFINPSTSEYNSIKESNAVRGYLKSNGDLIIWNVSYIHSFALDFLINKLIISGNVGILTVNITDQGFPIIIENRNLYLNDRIQNYNDITNKIVLKYIEKCKRKNNWINFKTYLGFL